MFLPLTDESFKLSFMWPSPLRTVIMLIVFFTMLGCQNYPKPDTASQHTTAEILYHVCQRSLYDSNGDQHGVGQAQYQLKEGRVSFEVNPFEIQILEIEN